MIAMVFCLFLFYFIFLGGGDGGTTTKPPYPPIRSARPATAVNQGKGPALTLNADQSDRQDTPPALRSKEERDRWRERQQERAAEVCLSVLWLVEEVLGGGGGAAARGCRGKLLYTRVLLFVVDLPPHFLDLLAPFISVSTRVHQVVGPVRLKR